MDSFSCSPLNTSFILKNKTWKRLHTLRCDRWRHLNITMTSRFDVRLFVFYLSLGLVVRVCEKNRLHHWCPVGTEKSQPEGPLIQWEKRLAEFPTERWSRVLGFFWNHWTPMIDSFSHIPILNVATLRYSTVISVGDVTEIDVYIQWRALYKSTWNSE